MPALNPFIYGKPVPPTRFVGRSDAVRTIFSRLRNGDSTAIVGEPHIGKSSLLRYVTDPAVCAEWLDNEVPRSLVAPIDCHMLSQDCTPVDFWRHALAKVPKSIRNEKVRGQWQAVEASHFDSFELLRLFERVAEAHWRVVLAIDELDVLLTHPNFKFEPQFFGSLRSIAIRTGGLVEITAGRVATAAMNQITRPINDGSPFFNHLIDVRLLPLSIDECRTLLEMTLMRTGIAFTSDDFSFIHALAGRHPFLVQMAAAGVYDAAIDGKTGEARYEAAGRLFHDQATAHFDHFWRFLTPIEQTAMVVLALGEMKARVEGREFDTGDLGEMKWYGPELAHLQDAGVVEQVDGYSGLDGLTLWQGGRWRAAARGFVWWVADNIVAGTRETVGFDAWLHDKEGRKLVTREQAEQLRRLVGAIPRGIASSPGQMGELLTLPQPGKAPRLRQLLIEHFNVEELRTLCTDLDIEHENVPGEGKEAKTRELVAYCARRGRLRELEDAIYESRPNIRQ